MEKGAKPLLFCLPPSTFDARCLRTSAFSPQPHRLLAIGYWPSYDRVRTNEGPILQPPAFTAFPPCFRQNVRPPPPERYRYRSKCTRDAQGVYKGLCRDQCRTHRRVPRRQYRSARVLACEFRRRLARRFFGSCRVGKSQGRQLGNLELLVPTELSSSRRRDAPTFRHLVQVSYAP